MSDLEQKAEEKRKLIVSTNNLGASNAYREKEEVTNYVGKNELGQVERREVKAVVKYTPQKVTFWQKLKKAVFGTEKIENIPEHLVLNVAVPALKQTFFDMFCGGLGMAFGIDYSRKRRSSDGGYTGFFKSGNNSRDIDDEDDYDDRRPSSYRDIGFDSKSDATEVYEVMLDYVRDQGYVTVLEFYGISDRISPNPRRDDRKGWDREDLRNPRIFEVKRKWYIDLPRPTLISDMRGE